MDLHFGIRLIRPWRKRWTYLFGSIFSELSRKWGVNVDKMDLLEQGVIWMVLKSWNSARHNSLIKVQNNKIKINNKMRNESDS